MRTYSVLRATYAGTDTGGVFLVVYTPPRLVFYTHLVRGQLLSRRVLVLLTRAEMEAIVQSKRPNPVIREIKCARLLF